MPLSEQQEQYIVQTTNSRGAAFNPPYTHADSTAGGTSGHEWLFIQVNTSEGSPGSSKKGPKGWLVDQGEFQTLVQDVLGQVERILR